jgi:hypothetical protein
MSADLFEHTSQRKRLIIYFKAKLVLAWRSAVLLLLLPFLVVAAIVTWSGLSDYYGASGHQHFPTWTKVLLALGALVIGLVVIFFVLSRVLEDSALPPVVIVGILAGKSHSDEIPSPIFVYGGQGSTVLEIKVQQAYLIKWPGALKPADPRKWLGDQKLAVSWWVWWPWWPRRMRAGLAEVFVCAPERIVLFRLKPNHVEGTSPNESSGAQPAKPEV